MKMDRYKLGDICEIVSGSTPRTSIAEYWDGDVKWITPAELDNDSYIITDTVRKITDLAVKKTGLSPFPEGTVILSSRAPIGKVAIAGCEMCCNQGFKNLICSGKVNNKYLYWFLKGNTEFLNSLGRGATFKEISKQIVADIEINIPDYNKQIEIAEHLEKINRIIQLRRQELVKLDDLIRSRFVEMFGNPIINDKGWKTAELNSVCEGIGDGLHGTPEYDENGGYPFINGNNLMNGVIEITQATKMVNKETYKKHYIRLTDNTILLSINGTLGKLAFYNGEEVMLGKSACYCNLKSDINKEFVYGVMKTDAFAGFLESNATASTIKNVGLKAIRGFNLILPPEELQNQFVEFSRQVDKSKLIELRPLTKYKYFINQNRRNA